MGIKRLNKFLDDKNLIKKYDNIKKYMLINNLKKSKNTKIIALILCCISINSSIHIMMSYMD